MTFTINKPKDINVALAKVSKTIKNGGGSFSGNNNSGNFGGNGVEGNYKVCGDRIIITITEKPFFYPASAVENRIREYFRSA